MSVRIHMRTTVRPTFPRLAPPGTVLVAGCAYEAMRDHRGDLYGVSDSGLLLPVRDGEYEWVIDERSKT